MVKLQHEDGQNSASKVTVHYDNKIQHLEVDDKGTVEVENRQQAKELMESHGKFFKLDEDEEPDHVLAGKTVTEVEEYIRDIEDVKRLKELRELEERKTGKEVIDSRISEVKELVEKGEENEEKVKQDEEQDGEETEDE